MGEGYRRIDMRGNIHARRAGGCIFWQNDIFSMTLEFNCYFAHVKNSIAIRSDNLSANSVLSIRGQVSTAVLDISII